MVAGLREWYGVEKERRMEGENKGPDGEGGCVCGGKGWRVQMEGREEREWVGGGETGEGEGQTCVFGGGRGTSKTECWEWGSRLERPGPDPQ